MSIRDNLEQIEQDVLRIRLLPPHQVRARGDARRRRHAFTAVATATVAVGAGVAVVAVTGGATTPSSTAAPSTDGVVWEPSASASACSLPSVVPDLPVHPGDTNGLTVTIFVQTGASADQVAAIRAKLDDLGFRGGIASIDYHTDGDYHMYRVRVPCDGEPSILDQPYTNAFVVTLVDSSFYGEVAASVNGMPGTDGIIRSLRMADITGDSGQSTPTP